MAFKTRTADKRAQGDAWTHMAEQTATEEQAKRLEDMLRRMRHHAENRDHACQQLIRAVHEQLPTSTDPKPEPSWFDPAPLAEARMFGRAHADSLDEEVLFDGFQTLRDHAPEPEPEPEPGLDGEDLL